MRYIETFFWGIIVALTSLIFEVFFSIILNDIFQLNFFSFNYQELTLTSAIISILIIATIEESLKFIIFLKRILLFSRNHSILAVNGFLLGLGFFTFEAVSSYYKGSLFITPFWQIAVVFLTHTFLGIFTMNSLAKFPKKYIIIVLVLNTILHSMTNLLILLSSKF